MELELKRLYRVFYNVGDYSQWLEYFKEGEKRVIYNLSCDCMSGTMEQSRHTKEWTKRKLCWHLSLVKWLFERGMFQD